MQIYLVGGAVRDGLMGHPMRDRDWVVVGGSPQAMLDLGFKPVGKDFPVFLHPTTHEEYALARTERKSAPGYHGFDFHAAPDVSLDQDLWRRDLTINAMAIQAEQHQSNGTLTAVVPSTPEHWISSGLLCDPFGGLNDLRQRVLRHVSPAFAEDPVRILRLARLAARLTGFEPAPETLKLMKEMVQAGEVHHLVAERVWHELANGLTQNQPEKMLEILQDCGALSILLPELSRLQGVPQSVEHHPEVDTWSHMMLVMAMCARLAVDLPVRVACLFHDLGKGTTPQEDWPRHIGHEQRSVRLLQNVCDRLRVSNECKDLALVMAKEHGHVRRCQTLGADALLRLLERCDAFRKPERFGQLLLACACDARGRLGFEDKPYEAGQYLEALWQDVRTVDTQAITTKAQAAGIAGPAVGALIHQARLDAISRCLPRV